MTEYSYYIAPIEYKIANENGISRELVNYRVRNAAWVVQEAITKPVKKKDMLYEKYAIIANKNGVSRNLFYQRIKRLGWSPLRAANTKPCNYRVIQAQNSIQIGHEVYRFVQLGITQEQAKIAYAHGISSETLRWRLKRSTTNWSVEEAITTPLLDNQERINRRRLKKGKNYFEKINEMHWNEHRSLSEKKKQGIQ